MKKDTPLIIIDNTNIKLWEMNKYVLEADKNNYNIEIKESQTEWAWNPSKCANKNTHGVPKDKIKIMIENF